MSIDVTLIFPVYSSLNSLNNLISQFKILPDDSYRSLEIIIINDSSKSIKKVDLRKLINQLPKSLNCVFISMPKNIGVGEVRNIGILKANSQKYIGFVDDDDTVNLSNLLNISEKYNSDIVISPITKSFDFIKAISYYSFNIKFILYFLKNGSLEQNL